MYHLKILYTSELLDGPKLQVLNDLHYGLSKMEILYERRWM